MMMVTITSLLQRQQQKKNAILALSLRQYGTLSLRQQKMMGGGRPTTAVLASSSSSAAAAATSAACRSPYSQQQQLRRRMMIMAPTTPVYTTSTSTTLASSCRFFSSHNNPTTTTIKKERPTVTATVDVDNEKSSSSSRKSKTLKKQQEEVVQEAEIVSETTTPVATAAVEDAVQETEEEDDDNFDDDDDDSEEGEEDDEEEEPLELGEDYFGSTPNQEAYQKVIDLARLTAELAYQRNNAMVGALAEAGGDEGAAERWLLGFVTLIQEHLPQWWLGKKKMMMQKSDTDDAADKSTKNASKNSAQQLLHRNALLSLANNRRGDYFIKRCIDPQVLKKRMGKDGYTTAQLVALEVINRVALHEEEGEKEKDDADSNQFFPLSKDAMEGAKLIWGKETMAELTKKTEEEIEEEQEMKQAQQEGLITQMEEGEWWGTATDKAPEQAYKRLIDAARHASMLAYDKGGRYIGAVADAVQTSGANEMDDYMNAEEDENFSEDESSSDSSDDNDDDESISDISDGDDDDDEKDVEGEDIINEDNSTDDIVHNGESEGDDKDTEKEQETKDAVYDPQELGLNAQNHFEQFLQEMEKAKMMPPWWNEEHEAAMWQLASDKEGKQFLGYPLDSDELKELYDDGARRKVLMLAEAAAADMDDMDSSEQPLDEMKKMADIENSGDFTSDMDDLPSTEEDDDSSKKKDN